MAGSWPWVNEPFTSSLKTLSSVTLLEDHASSLTFSATVSSLVRVLYYVHLTKLLEGLNEVMHVKPLWNL